MTSPNQKTEAALTDIEARQRQIAADKAAADKEQDAIDRQIAQLREQAAANAKAQHELDEQRERLEREAIDRQRDLRPDHVDREVASSVATDLLDAFEAVHVAEADMVGPDRRDERLWDAIDDARCRLLTDDIAEDARLVVLAIEGVIDACDLFESFRRPEFQNPRNSDGEPLRDIRAWAFPEQSALVRSSLDELRRELSGDDAPNPIEGVGELVGQNVTFRQICEMHGMLLPDGSADIGALGQLIERALGRVGFYREIAGRSHLVRMAALNAADAWAMRSNSLERRRTASHTLPGSAARLGALRPGRMMEPPAPDGVDEAEEEAMLAKRRAFHRARLISDAEAAAAAAKENFKVATAADWDSFGRRFAK
ncbi:hypothetical protein Poly24_06570 [Rosistilla carotiformis]|uniref:Uncharacterized protein n=1 Tax=Rosistilla carotiformis TaxID=2528017 RepID=A0A518JN70_9BACT|nr:hypothetical protein [Rosistilla carotiformis]QDV66967.1 hypothetical protein Poly24_06570 [Rosistilla carotiformis]